MPINPLAPGAYKATNASRILTQTRLQLDDVQRQVVTGKRSETFGGLGAQRITALSLRAKSSEITSYQSTITTLQFRAKQLDLGLTQLGKISDDIRSSTVAPQFNPDATGKTTMQKYARARLDEAIDVLNTETNGQHIYSGRTSDVRPVLNSETILNGDTAGRAGLVQLIVERKAADLGSGTGRLTLGGVGSNATLTEDGAHPFGFKLTAASSTSSGIATTLTAGPPANLDFNVTALPADGEEVRIGLTLPDGSTQALTLTAKTGPLLPPGNASQFEIGATPAITAANLRLAVAAAVNRESTTSLPAASAQAASTALFAGSLTNPPLRVLGPPATATALVAGTPANTVIWYQGDDTSPSARATVSAKIDTSITVSVGVQANEQGIRRVLSNLAAFVSESFTTSDVDKGRYQMLSDRIRADLGAGSGAQRVQDIQVEIASAAVTMKQADDRHRTKLGIVESTISDIEDVSKEEAAATLLALQTQLQASYQTTAIISRLNLTDYLR
jgi:flagellar hook-associated protein 3 FlgL